MLLFMLFFAHFCTLFSSFHTLQMLFHLAKIDFQTSRYLSWALVEDKVQLPDFRLLLLFQKLKVLNNLAFLFFQSGLKLFK